MCPHLEGLQNPVDCFPNDQYMMSKKQKKIRHQDPFKVQDRAVDFHVAEYESFLIWLPMPHSNLA